MPLNLPSVATPPIIPQEGENTTRAIMRLINIFGGPQSPQQSPTIPAPAPLPEQGPIYSGEEPPNDLPSPMDIPPPPGTEIYPQDDLYGGFEPEYPQLDAFVEHLQNMPEREDPGFLRRLGSVMIGIGQGPQAQNEFLHGGFNRKMSDWETGLEGHKAAMTAERFATGEKGSQSRSQATNDIRMAEHMLDVAEHTLDVYKEMYPEMELKEQKGGNYVLINPRTGETIDTGVATGLMDEARKLMQDHANEMTQIHTRTQGQLDVAGEQGRQSRKTARTRGEVSRTIEGERQKNRLELEREKQANRIEELEKKADEKAKGKGLTPSAEKQRRLNVANRIIAENPEAEDFITIEDGGVRIAEAGKERPYWFDKKGPEAEQRRQWFQEIYGLDDNDMPTPIEAETGQVTMIAPDGVTEGIVDASEVERLEGMGYSRK